MEARVTTKLTSNLLNRLRFIWLFKNVPLTLPLSKVADRAPTLEDYTDIKKPRSGENQG
jgi:hypothetical protein